MEKVYSGIGDTAYVAYIAENESFSKFIDIVINIMQFFKKNPGYIGLVIRTDLNMFHVNNIELCLPNFIYFIFVFRV